MGEIDVDSNFERMIDLHHDERRSPLVDGLVTEEQWQAILCNDASQDPFFFYAVKTTHIFCRPSCKSRPPARENVCTFLNAEQAITAGFRPCKRCKPLGERMPDQEWVAEIVQCIHLHYAESLTLHTLAERCHGSPYHLQRTFKRIIGVSPVAYIQHTRIMHASEMLLHTERSISDIAQSVGVPSTPYFITLFKKITGYTPASYRQYMRDPAAQDQNRGDERTNGEEE